MPVSGGPQSFDPVFNPDKCTVAPIAPIPAIPAIEDCLVLPAPANITDCIDPPVPFPSPGAVAAAGPAGPAGAAGPPGGAGPAGPAGEIQVLVVQDKCPQGLVLQVQSCQVLCNQSVCDCVVTIKPCPVTPQTPAGCCFQFTYLLQIPQVQGPIGPTGMTGTTGLTGLTGPQGPQGPQGGKTAILAFYDGDGDWEAPEGPTGEAAESYGGAERQKPKVKYLGLFCMEMPQPRFEDILVVTMRSDEDLPAVVDIDERLAQFCSSGSIEVVGTACNKPLVFGAEVVGNRVYIEGLKGQKFKDARLCVRISGLRADLPTERFPEYSKEQAKKNSAFWNQALRGDG